MSRKLWDGDTFEHRGHTFRVRIEDDEHHGAPNEENDGHGVVTRRRYSHERYPSKRAGERIIAHGRDSGTIAYDVQATMAIAKRDGWGLSEDNIKALAHRLGRTPTKGDIRAQAVANDFDYLRSWYADEWRYAVVTVALLDDAGEERDGYRESCGGVDNYGRDGWAQCGMPYELADNIVAQLQEERKAQLKEYHEAQHWTARGVETRNTH